MLKFGKLRNAFSTYSKILELEPNKTNAQLKLAEFLFLGKQIEQAMEKFPDDPAIADTLGLVYYKKGLYGNAEVEFSDALKKLPNNSEILFHLGQTYAQKGENDKAKASLEKALKLNSKFQGYQEAKQILNDLK